MGFGSGVWRNNWVKLWKTIKKLEKRKEKNCPKIFRIDLTVKEIWPITNNGEWGEENDSIEASMLLNFWIGSLNADSSNDVEIIWQTDFLAKHSHRKHRWSQFSFHTYYLTEVDFIQGMPILSELIWFCYLFKFYKTYIYSIVMH